MTLTAQTYRNILAALRTDPRPISDRRRYPRVGLRAKVNITPLDENRRPTPTVCVGVRDFSAGGFGLIIPAGKLQNGQLFVVRLEDPREDPLPLLCQVVQKYAADRIGARILHSTETNAQKDQSQEEESVSESTT
jgi:hypothetical protein